jgi:hypothetical protein
MSSEKKQCQVCDGKMNFAFRHLVLHKYEVSYYRCVDCGFMCTEKPYWLEEAYSSPISSNDTGILTRNISIASRLSPILSMLFGAKGHYVDMAGGYGLLTRLMRDFGFDFLWKDPYCKNIFAEGFEYTPSDQGHQSVLAVTAFEVIEHLEDPVKFFKEIKAGIDVAGIVISTQMIGEDVPDESWWYYSFSSGQHIAFYTSKSLKIIANKLGYFYYSIGGLQVFVRERSILKVCALKLVARFGVVWLLLHRILFGSLTLPDAVAAAKR